MKTSVIALVAALAGSVMSVEADTVVWYDFDGLGEAGTSVSHGTTIQNKANPGTLDVSSFGFVNYWTKSSGNSNHMPAAADGYGSAVRIYDPVSESFSTNVDGAVLFTAPISHESSDNQAGAFQGTDDSNALGLSTFTLELILKIPAKISGTTDQTILAKTVEDSGIAYSWKLAWYGGSQLCFLYWEGGTMKQYWLGSDLADGEWHHLAIIFNPSWETWSLRRWVDYEEVSGAYANPASIQSGAGRLVIGAEPYMDGSTEKFRLPAREIAISELRISDAVLSTAQFLKANNVPTGRTISHVTFDDGTVNAAAEYGTLCDGRLWASNADSSVKPTVSDDVPGIRIRDGENGEILSRDNTRSMSFPGNSHYPACALWGRSVSNQNDARFVPLATDGDARMSGTIEFWMKPTPGRQVAWSSQPALLNDYRNDDSQVIWRFVFTSNSESDPVPSEFHFNVNMCTNDAGATVWKGMAVCPSENLLDGKWHHVAAVFQPSEANPGKTDIVTYVDYGEAGKASFDGVIDYREGAYTLQMGMRYEGLIDEFRISDRALTPNQFLRAEKAPGLSIFVR